MNILLTSVGRRSYLARYFREALDGTGKVIGANAIADTAGMLACDITEVTPFAFDDDYIPLLLQICERYEVRLLFSLHDLDALFIAEARDQFEAIGTTPVLADRYFLDIALDKFKTVDFVTQHGLHAPRTWTNVETALAGDAGRPPRFPLIVKPRWGFGSIGLQIAHNAGELPCAWSLAMSLVANSWIVHAPGWDRSRGLIIQEMVNGNEYGIDIINDLDGQYVTTFAKRKYAMRSGETDSAVTVDDENLIAFGRAMGQLSKHPGALDVDVIVEDGLIHVIELNPRFGGHYPFAHLAGANIPAALLAWKRGEEPDPAWLTAEAGVRGYKDPVPIRTDG